MKRRPRLRLQLDDVFCCIVALLNVLSGLYDGSGSRGASIAIAPARRDPWPGSRTDTWTSMPWRAAAAWTPGRYRAVDLDPLQLPPRRRRSSRGASARHAGCRRAKTARMNRSAVRI